MVECVEQYKFMITEPTTAEEAGQQFRELEANGKELIEQSNAIVLAGRLITNQMEAIRLKWFKGENPPKPTPPPETPAAPPA